MQGSTETNFSKFRKKSQVCQDGRYNATTEELNCKRANHEEGVAVYIYDNEGRQLLMCACVCARRFQEFTFVRGNICLSVFSTRCNEPTNVNINVPKKQILSDDLCVKQYLQLKYIKSHIVP